MKTITTVFSLLMIAGAACMIIVHILYFPANRSGYILTGPALLSGALYTLILFNLHSGVIARMRAKLRRLQPAQVKRFFAQVIMWIVAVGALAFSATACTAPPRYEGDNWHNIGIITTGDTTEYYYEMAEMAVFKVIIKVNGETVDSYYYTIDADGNFNKQIQQ